MYNVLWERLRDFDAYPKPLEDFRIKTFGGGAVTIISSAFMLFLFISELRDYVTPVVTEELFVDSSRSHKLRINIDIIFPRVACSYLSMDIMDSSGEQQTSFDHNIFKKSLDADGNPKEGETATSIVLNEHKKEKKEKGHGHGEKEGEKEGHTGEEVKKEDNKETPALTNTTAVDTPAQCGSCYGAETKTKKCCNSCDEVREAYRLKGWAIANPQEIEQCKEMAQDMKKIFNEGCQIYGYMEVNKVSGSFHIAPGKSFSLNHVHVHDVQPFTSSQFNMTHTIQTLTFGENIPGKTNPIDGIVGSSKEESTMFQYYLKIVPMTFEKLDGSTVFTNQFSTTRHQKVVSSMSGESGMPGVFFSFEISPIMVKLTEKSRSFGNFATGICAIIGGVFTVAGLIDSTIYKSSKVLKKLEIGKNG